MIRKTGSGYGFYKTDPALGFSGAVVLVTGFNPLAVSVFVNNGRLIMEASFCFALLL